MHVPGLSSTLFFLVPQCPEMVHGGSPFGEWARLFCMPASYGTYRVHDNLGMKSTAPKAPIVMPVTVGLRIFSVRVRTAANISQELLGDEGAKCTPWTQEPRLTIF